MPIYEYCCPDCEHKFDLLRPFSQADEDVTCPKCSQQAKRLISSFAKDSSGVPTPIGGGNSCSSCSATSCASCR